MYLFSAGVCLWGVLRVVFVLVCSVSGCWLCFRVGFLCCGFVLGVVFGVVCGVWDFFLLVRIDVSGLLRVGCVFFLLQCCSGGLDSVVGLALSGIV